jgi:hypothetical protein
LTATWLTLRDTPFVFCRNKAGRWVPNQGFLQDGHVWQAEEVQTNGRWQRFYGFVGSHRVARVPAAEIEFPADPADAPWLRFANKVEARLGPPLATIDADQPGPPRRVVGGSVPVPVAVRNAGGLPAVAPDLNRHLGIRPWHSPEAVARPGMLVPTAKTDADWQELAPTPGPAFPAGTDLEAATQMIVGNLDLSSWFDLSRPGFYRVRLTVLGRPDDGGEPIVFSLGHPSRR